MAFSTVTTARSTPAQYPRGAARSTLLDMARSLLGRLVSPRVGNFCAIPGPGTRCF
ncbi:unannotated protein [freshwater metagenome]|uniref:Unannotated protein n=1 Tax=freshwater metagenome TaxID=449393 RepID=A0A6J6G7S8_9ZZZZ